MKDRLIILLSLFTIVFATLSLCACGEKSARHLGMIERSGLDIIREDNVILGDIHWQLLKVEEVGPEIVGEFGTLEAIQGRFIYIEFSLENSGQEIRQLFDLKVIDDKGRIYSICNEAYGYFTGAPSACVLQDIIPDMERTFSASFDIPLDSVDLILEVTDLKIPPREKAYIDLGL